jgi:catechol 2,3-dioxygenase-like lactoylglutathione lyase family enzyme
MLQDTPAFNGYSIRNMAEAKGFYQETLGLKAEELPMGMGISLKLHGGQRVFLYQKDDHQPATFTVLNFEVDHIDPVIDELIARGIKFEVYDTLPAKQDEKGVLRGKAVGMGPDIAWFKDPSNNILALLEN